MTTWILMNRRNEVLAADYDEEIHAFSRVLEVIEPSLTPYAIRETNGSVSRSRLQSWWNERAIPATRDDFKRLRDGLCGASPISLLEDALGLSLTDQFWMHRSDDHRTWDDVNFFTNGFGPELGYLTLGSFSPEYRSPSPSTPSPNSSLGGNLKKAWETRDDKPILVKAGADPLRLEPYSELAATKLYERALRREEYVPYDLELRDGRPYSTCPCMVDDTESFVPMWDVIQAFKRRGNESPWTHLLGCCKRIGLEDAELSLSKMFVCDYILANSDRHWGNFGVIFDSETMRPKKMAPIFDTGAALWSRVAVLDSERDFWYRPLPLIPERARRIYPEDQLSLIRMRDWLNPDALVDFEDQVRDILETAPYNQPKRVDSICRRVRENITMLLPGSRPELGRLFDRPAIDTRSTDRTDDTVAGQPTSSGANRVHPETKRRPSESQPDLGTTLADATRATGNFSQISRDGSASKERDPK